MLNNTNVDYLSWSSKQLIHELRMKESVNNKVVEYLGDVEQGWNQRSTIRRIKPHQL